jgi:hypothetical protein
VTYKGTKGPLKDWFRDQHLVVGYRDQLKHGPTMMVHPHRSLPPPPNKWPTMPFLHDTITTFIGVQARHSEMRRDQRVKQQLLLGSKRTLSEALRSLGPEVVKLTVGSSIVPQKTSVRTLWRSQPTPKQKKRPLTAYVLVL